MNWFQKKRLIFVLNLYKYPPLLWLLTARLQGHRADKLERQLMECYRKFPKLHYDNCSDYARELLFTKPDADGWVDYIDPNVQTVEPP